ncbi:MAG: methyltransferase domain-containing protein [Acidobacteria bacterium]|nr:methyltransferase domain-containing protein [Acidobacteriota bacterium]
MKFILFLFALFLQDQGKPPEKAAPYYPTPQVVVDRMLKLGELKKGEKVYDLGSGDGRIVIAAAQKFGATAVGVEYDKALVTQSRQRLSSLNLNKLASIIEGDIFEQNYADADLITVYLLPITNIRLSPVLEKTIKKGVRIVCHDFEFTEWNPEKTEVMEDTEGRSHTLFFYRR